MRLLRMTCLFVAAQLSTVTLAGSTVCGDITEAVRVAGGGAVVTSSLTPNGNVDPARLFNGVVQAERVLYASSDYTESTPLVLTYEIPASFKPGEDVVVTGVTFLVGASNGTGGKYVSYDTRLPSSMSLEGSQDGDVWSTIFTATNYPKSAYADVQEDSVFKYRAGTFDVVNWKSFRHYRLTILKTWAMDNAYPAQISEIRLLGLYGGSVEQPVPGYTDITAVVRKKVTPVLDSNLSVASDTLVLEKAFDGKCSGTLSDRFLSASDSTTAALANGGAWISYAIPEMSPYGADVIVTGYTLETWSGNASALERMPKSWAFQGANDEADWHTLDTQTYAMWSADRMTDDLGVDKYSHTFSFANSVPYQRYRLLITQLNGGTQVQFSEIRFTGWLIDCTAFIPSSHRIP